MGSESILECICVFAGKCAFGSGGRPKHTTLQTPSPRKNTPTGTGKENYNKLVGKQTIFISE